MPKAYEAIRNKFTAQGMALKSAKTHAARIYNAAHPSTPVGPHSDSKPKPPPHKFTFSRPDKKKR